MVDDFIKTTAALKIESGNHQVQWESQAEAFITDDLDYGKYHSNYPKTMTKTATVFDILKED